MKSRRDAWKPGQVRVGYVGGIEHVTGGKAISFEVVNYNGPSTWVVRALDDDRNWLMHTKWENHLVEDARDGR